MIFLAFAFFILIAFFAFKIDGYYSRYHKILFLSFGFLLVLYVGFRLEESVHDYGVYLIMFDDPNLVIEPTFLFITYLVKRFFAGEVIFLFLTYAIIGVSIKIRAIQELTSLIFFSLLVYVSNFLILHEMTQMRVGIASGILLLCIKPIYERNLARFLLLCTIAVLFHYAALLIFLFWFLDSTTPRKKLLALAVPAGYIVYFLGIDLILIIPISYIHDKITFYKDLMERGIDGYEINVFNSLFLLRCAIYYLLLFKYELLLRNNKYSIILLKIYGLSLFAFPGFAVLPVVAFRINELLAIVEIILVPTIIYLVTPARFAKFFVFTIALAMLLLNIYYNKYIL